jgi:hypothetical protein
MLNFKALYWSVIIFALLATIIIIGMVCIIFNLLPFSTIGLTKECMLPLSNRAQMVYFELLLWIHDWIRFIILCAKHWYNIFLYFFWHKKRRRESWPLTFINISNLPSLNITANIKYLSLCIRSSFSIAKISILPRKREVEAIEEIPLGTFSLLSYCIF